MKILLLILGIISFSSNAFHDKPPFSLSPPELNYAYAAKIIWDPNQSVSFVITALRLAPKARDITARGKSRLVGTSPLGDK